MVFTANALLHSCVLDVHQTCSQITLQARLSRLLQFFCNFVRVTPRYSAVQILLKFLPADITRGFRLFTASSVSGLTTFGIGSTISSSIRNVFWRKHRVTYLYRSTAFYSDIYRVFATWSVGRLL